MSNKLLTLLTKSLHLGICLSLITFSAWSCSTGKQTTEQNAFKIVKATSQPWAGGEIGTGTGVDYKVLLVIKQQSIGFDSLWTKQHKLPIKPVFRPHQYAQPPYGEGDTVMLKARWNKRTGKKSSPEQNSSKTLQGAGLLKYQQQGNVHYAIIDTFNKLPKVHYPTQN